MSTQVVVDGVKLEDLESGMKLELPIDEQQRHAKVGSLLKLSAYSLLQEQCHGIVQKCSAN